MTNCTVCPQEAIAESTELLEFMDMSPDTPHLYTEHGVYSMEYFHWPAWVSCLAMIPPSSCKFAQELNMRNQKKDLNFLETAIIITVTNMLLILNPKHSSY